MILCYMKRNTKHCFSILFFSLLLLSSVTCYAEKTYAITETELLTLENRLQILDENNTKLQESWNEQQKRIENALISSRKTEQQLVIAEKSLNEYIKEQKRIKREKDFYKYITIAVLVFAAFK